VVLLGVPVFLVVMEVLLRLLVVPVEQGWSHRVDLVYRAEGGDVILGDSHTFRGFVTRDDFVNLSGGGSSTQANEIVVREYFRYREPGRVIVGASPQLFNRVRDLAGAQQHDEYFVWNRGLPFVPYVFEPGVARHVGELLDPGDLIARAREAQLRKRPGNAFDAFLQREMLQKSPAERETLAKRIVRKNRPMEGFRTGASWAAYRRTLEWLAARGAEICMIRTAVTPRVEELAEGDERYREAHAALRELARELGARYVDYRDLGVSFGDDLFIDPDHLTARGAELFSGAVIPACFEVSETRRGG
jgi:hypothetical protein